MSDMDQEFELLWQDWSDLSIAHTKLKKHSQNQRKELRRLNRAVNLIGEVKRTRIGDFWETKGENRELKRQLKVYKIYAGGFGLCFIIYTVAVWGNILS
jgi:hypothetical protein